MRRKQDIIDHLDKFTRAYIEAILFTSTDESTPAGGEPLDKKYSTKDLSHVSLTKIVADCEKFQQENEADILSSPQRAGHDFWLTRNRMGAGFWDGCWPKEVGERLTKNAHAYGEVYVSVYRGVILTTVG